MLLCLLFVSNMATYVFTRFFFSRHALDVAGERDKAGVLWEVWDILDDKYFQPLNPEKMIRGATEGLLETLEDPQTRYLEPESLEEMLIHTTGSFSGIGVQIAEDEGEILVLRIMDGSPAQRAGLLEGDRITAVDKKSMQGVALDEAARLLRGPSGTEVNVTVRRVGVEEPFSVNLTRADIEMDTVFARLLHEGIGYLQITNFDRDTGRDLSSSLRELEEKNISGLIIDLRNNPGGLLEEAIEVGKVIVPAGEITRMVDRNGNVIERYYSDAEPKEYPIVVLINEFTASAAEIIAGALQDSDKAVLVGKPTYGKATVQHLQFLSDGGGLRYTIAKYVTPAGQDLHLNGLQPDYPVELPDEYYLQYRSVPSRLQLGDTGESVVLLQKMLQFLGYPVELTGVFHEGTLQSVKKFQEEHDLQPTGELKRSTREKIRTALSKKADQADMQLQKAAEVLSSSTLTAEGGS